MTDLAVRVHRTLNAPVQRVFEAWTRPEHLSRWWGPPGVRCVNAAMDLRVGGSWCIDNALPDGTVIRFAGVFEAVDVPSRLVYSWCRPPDETAERVTVRFEAVAQGTAVTLVHERIRDPAAQASHLEGWNGCLDGLVAWLAAG